MDQFEIHEALDRCYVIQGMIDSYLQHEPAVIANPEIFLKVSQAQKALGEAYQMIGALGDEPCSSST